MEIALPKWGWKVWLAIAIAVAVIGLVIAFPTLSRTSARLQVEEELKTLQDRLAAISVNGGDPIEADQIRQRIRVLTTNANQYGSDLDLGTITLSGCDAMQNRIDSEMRHYLSTSYDDPVKRENTRRSMLTFGSTLAECFDQAIADSEDRAALLTIRQSIISSIAKSEQRRVGWETGSPGYDRFGVNEPHGFDKAAAERDLVQAKLRANLATANAKLSTMSNTLGAA